MFYINISEDDLALKTHLQSSHIFAAEKKTHLDMDDISMNLCYCNKYFSNYGKKVLQQ